ncbi:hypothetical protein TcG_05744 [Trypanosoma cruzi]|nr:hypothetical protein TcBrA4_0102120 [Trypanosoma cruzi]RNF17209.1 hypothetical protein TcG_05744 [Trypanosoma cruzi]
MCSTNSLEGIHEEERPGDAALLWPEGMQRQARGECGPSLLPFGAAPDGTNYAPYVVQSTSTCAVPFSEMLESALYSSVEALATRAAEDESGLINACAPPSSW